MTRINANLDPKTLKRMHLIAEYREITMVPAALRRSMRTKTKQEILAGIPKKFTLNAGHVKFFYNKQGFLIKRFNALIAEMKRRGYKYDLSRADAFLGFDNDFNYNWESTPEDDAIVQERIALRISQKPHLYIGE
jgi:deoxyribonuclease (pyrimidine dimer)